LSEKYFLERIRNGYKPDYFIGDKGYRGRRVVNGVQVVTHYDQKKDSGVEPKEARDIKNRCRRCS
jgi:hypothetical protein